MSTERHQKFIETLITANNLAGEPITAARHEELEEAVNFLLPLWDEIMPLIVSDVVKAVKKELQNV